MLLSLLQPSGPDSFHSNGTNVAFFWHDSNALGLGKLDVGTWEKRQVLVKLKVIKHFLYKSYKAHCSLVMAEQCCFYLMNIICMGALMYKLFFFWDLPIYSNINLFKTKAAVTSYKWQTCSFLRIIVHACIKGNCYEECKGWIYLKLWQEVQMSFITDILHAASSLLVTKINCTSSRLCYVGVLDEWEWMGQIVFLFM